MLDKLQKLNLKNKIIASLSGFILIFFCLIYFIVIPTIKDIRAMDNDIEEQRIDLEKKYIKGYSLKQLTENLKKIQPKLSQLDQIFINKNDELKFITTLENEADQAGVIQKINLNPPQAADSQKFQKNNLQLSTKGGFHQQLKYLQNLESLSYYINVYSIEFISANKPEAAAAGQAPLSSPNETSVNMLISADTYWE